jgi:hypothetical protein
MIDSIRGLLTMEVAEPKISSSNSFALFRAPSVLLPADTKAFVLA